MQFIWKVTSRLFQALWAACFSRQVIIDSLDEVKIRSLWRSCLLLQNFLLFSELISLWLWSCVWDHYFEAREMPLWWNFVMDDRLLVHHITASPSSNLIYVLQQTSTSLTQMWKLLFHVEALAAILQQPSACVVGYMSVFWVCIQFGTMALFLVGNLVLWPLLTRPLQIIRNVSLA